MNESFGFESAPVPAALSATAVAAPSEFAAADELAAFAGVVPPEPASSYMCRHLRFCAGRVLLQANGD